MLKKEVLLDSEVLKTLNPEQLAEIEKLSANDEQTIIDTNRSEWWKGIDNDIKEVFGLEKEAGIKTYQHLKNVLIDSRNKAKGADELSGKIKTYESTIEEMREQLKNGNGDELLKTQIESLKTAKLSLTNEIESMKTTYKEREVELQKLQEERENDKIRFGVESRFGNVLNNGIKFIESIPKSVLDREIADAKKRVFSKGSVKQEGDKFVFYGEDGTKLKNPKKGLDPYSAEDLFLEELMSSGIISKERKAGGAGGAGGKKGDNKHVDLSGVSTQVEAVGIIEKMVLENGTPKTSPNFLKEVRAIAKANKVFDLPQQ